MAQSTIVGQDNNRVKSASTSQKESAQSSPPPSTSAGKRQKKSRGLSFERRYTSASGDALGDMTWEGRTSVITNPDGSVVFKMDGAEIPAGWSQLATDIVVSKYFRKAGLHGDKAQGETSVKQVVHRIAHTIRNYGEQAGGYFATKKDADTFEAELVWMMANQYGRLQFAGLVQLWPVPRVRHRKVPAATGLGTNKPKSAKKRATPIAGRNARLASSSPWMTT